MKARRIYSWILTIAVLATMLPCFAVNVGAEENVASLAAEPAVTQISTRENQNQAGGIVYTKTSTAKSDGTVDITLTAHTTGEVKQLTSVSPTDIVLVLDVSGSMGDNYTTTTTEYVEVSGKQYTYTTGYWPFRTEHTAYGMETTSGTYYINTGTGGNPVYTKVEYTGRDDNGFELYEYTEGNTLVYVYPALGQSVSATPANTSYDVVQFYKVQTSRQSINKMTSLKDAVNSFIDTTAQMNKGLEKDQMHSISIVKFANNSYYNSTVATVVEGDHKGAGNNSGYNYSEVVKNLTPVDTTGATQLKNAINALSAGGATAVDYGLNLAEAVLKNRSTVVEEGAVDRNEVVIVFTDGSPTHSNGFNTNVANSAISIAGKMEKEAGVTVYGVCIEAAADSTDISEDINKFMHYMTSNFPNATSMTSPGADGNINKGYYKTTDDTHSLSMLFESIIQDIDHPTIVMGEEAAMIDTLSPYFDFINGSATNVTLQTSARNQDGTWAQPVADSTLSYTIENDRLTVDGFDFDSNYVSENGRGANDDFYGKQLVVTFTIIPDYAVIDTAYTTLSDGIIPTNSGFATLVNSDQISAAEVDTPELSTHQVTYIVDGEEYKEYNRFTGSKVIVDEALTKEGYTFSGWTMDGNIVASGSEFVMPDSDVEITAAFTANSYNVTYQYSTTPPDGAPTLPESFKAHYGDEITIAPPLQFEGYVFEGWYLLQTDVDVSDGKFKMPAKDVTIVGYFENSTSTPYKIEHYMETLTDGVYENNPEFTETFYGTTGHLVVAKPLNRFTGFSYNSAASAKTTSGEIKANGKLVLKLYYDRDSYKVTYAYTGDIPDDAPDAPKPKDYKYGESVTVEPDAMVDGYTFNGWESQSTDATAGEEFEMPAHDVAFVGEFTANTDTQYKVEYYLENLNGGYDLNETASYTGSGTTGSTVYANQKIFTGFVFDNANANNKLSGTIKGDGSLVLKAYYNRKLYTVTYSYEGQQPDDAPELPVDDKEYKYGETVIVKDDLALEGYTFAGWHSTGYTVNNTTERFEMPARNLTLYGNFEPESGVEWKEQHYFEELDGSYPEEPKYAFTHTGTTGATAEAAPITEVPGFVFDDDYEGNITSMVIEGDGSTTLKFHYKRISYSVSYIYDPAQQPDGAPTLPETITYMYGEEVTIEDQLELLGYTFVGWYPEQEEIPEIGTFEMPAYDVAFVGYFTPRSDTEYEVHHFLQNVDGSYPATTEYINKHSGTTGTEVIAVPRNFEGYTLNEGSADVKGIVEADGSLVLELYYDRNTYTVTYGYDGDIPENAPELPVGNSYKYGEEVTVEDKAIAPTGYVFVGWYRGTADKPVSGTFHMPNYNVNILGYFAESDNTPYRVEHYLQTIDGTDYELDGESVIRHGTTGATVGALARVYPGFVYNSGKSNPNGTVSADGSLALKFYYDRNTYDVTYVYEGIIPEDAPTVPEKLTDVYYGTEVDVEAQPDIPGFLFSGWTTDDVTINSGAFVMPDKDVVLKGGFTSNTVDYKVNYWLQNLDAGTTFDADDYTLDSEKSYTRQAFTGQHVEADAVEIEGFYVNKAHSNSYGHVTADEKGAGNLVLNVYFDRHTYNVTYAYYGEQPANAPDLSDKNISNVLFGTEITVDTTPELKGYAFDGWYTHTATVEDGKFTMPAHDVEMLGLFVTSFIVGYDLNGGEGDEAVDYGTKDIEINSEITVNVAPARSGYTFKGWVVGTDTYNPGDTVTVDKNTIFVAQWDRVSGGGGGGASGITTIAYTLNYETNGGNVIESEKYKFGENVNITKVPVKAGYVFEGWYLDQGLTQNVTEVKMTKNTTLYASWVNDNGGAGHGHRTPANLNGDDHFAYVVGYPDGTVRPNDSISRAEVTSIFFRLLKPDEVRDNNLTNQNNFEDVNEGDWYNTAISTMNKLGIVNGRYENKFVPDAFITRAEFAAICARFDDSEYEITDNFTDVAGHWAEAEIHEAAAYGWIKGYEDGTFKPDQFITRAEAMVMINRVLNRVPETAEDLLENMIKWPDNSDKAEWYYLAVQEATNSHEYKKKNNIYEKWTGLREVTDWTKYEE